jgi:D-serine deaminase-like pyridoxal phosphate-dependent protein
MTDVLLPADPTPARTFQTLQAIPTPALLLDRDRMERNIARMQGRMARLGVPLRPHVKTCKSDAVARRILGGTAGPITVSTLKEAAYFADRGYTDILYAVGITPGKLTEVARLLRRGVRLRLVLDEPDAARAVVAAAERERLQFGVMLEIDCDGHRSGLDPASDELLAVADALRCPFVSLDGVMTHAGESYACRTPEALRAMAEQERAAVVLAASRLRAAGHAAPMVSVGSTPTALFAEDLAGVTEVRAGVFVFFDLVMAGIGVCTQDDIAVSVLTTVIGHQRAKGWIIVDAGWMALSRDRGTAGQPVDQGYGVVCDAEGRVMPDLIVGSANQEHGILMRRDGAPGPVPELPVGAQLRILPNHVCATAAQHDAYHVVSKSSDTVEHWPRFSGWA